MDEQGQTETQTPTATPLPGCPAAQIISAAQFADLHTAHLVAHPPDGVLFPFLHGLEGDNHAQNTFFAATAPKGPPRFRGLVWVIAEEELGLGLEGPIEGDAYSDDGSYSDEDDSEEDELVDMDIDNTVHIVNGDLPTIQTIDTDAKEDDDDAKHMHPVQHRGDLFASPTSDVPMEISLPLPTPATPSSFSSVPSQYSDQPPPTTINESEWDPQNPPLLTCSFRPKELIRPVEHAPPFTPVEDSDEDWEFRPARVPDGISLRNFGIQVPIYTTLSDIVLYSPHGLAGSQSLVPLAKRFAAAVQRKRAERLRKLGMTGDEDDAPLEYHVYVLDADATSLRAEVPELMMRVFDGGEGRVRKSPSGMEVEGDEDITADAPVAVPIRPHTRADTAPNTIDFAQRERDEMRELTRATEILTVRKRPSSKTARSTSAPTSDSEDEEDLSMTTTATHWRPTLGQVFLGNSGDVPLGLPLQAVPSSPSPSSSDSGSPEEPAQDLHDPFTYNLTNSPEAAMGYDICVECHEMAPFPSPAHLRAAEDHITMLESMWAERERMRIETDDDKERRIRPPPNANTVVHLPFPSAPPNTPQTMNAMLPVVAFLERCLWPAEEPSANGGSSARRWTSPGPAGSMASFFPNPPSPVPSPPPTGVPRSRSLVSPGPQPAPTTVTRSRPLKILIYSSDGYTESSPLALTLLMAARRLSLPEAYLELQVAKRRSFFVYPGEVGLLRRVEGRVRSGERERDATVFAPVAGRLGLQRRASTTAKDTPNVILAPTPKVPSRTPSPQPFSGQRPPAKSVSFAVAPNGHGHAISASVPNESAETQMQTHTTRSGRPRATTSPWLPSFGDHQSWFNDPRFDGSFPSRVLPFLYLGNLNHATNAYMLHALGITHVVSVGECALIPPPGHCHAPVGETCTSASCRAHNQHGSSSVPNSHFIPGKGPAGQGVLDIKNICDDGIDTLEPQLAPICDWIEKARLEGGQVLVHCRVGVSRSATVTIAYVMKHLGLPLVDAYLIVRSRRLSVLIQPNMRLMWNLCGWEIELAKERARAAGDGEDAKRLRKELARTLTWPFLAKEVHALNEKYLH
ncbi:hypothetical protein HMN09_01147700 [Mycena chlorophos]|uniref:Uncharacterized protein n=1 Tax=Mycena chlorophos TaxID=658473 RepID=A0A8H6S7D3_MYCCL|nr:hypothetical protein HMN09_01147700 [Mycena chlorophos]